MKASWMLAAVADRVGLAGLAGLAGLVGLAGLAGLVGLAGLAGMTAGPAVAQQLIAPSRSYGTYAPPKSTLEKGYGLPTFGTPGAMEPKQKTMEPKPVQPEQPDPFRPSTTLGTAAPQSSGTPDFFAAAPSANSSDTPDFFQSTPDAALPKARISKPGTATGETPLFTTTQGMSGDDTTSDKANTGDTPAD
jgi:hypothetical protein